MKKTGILTKKEMMKKILGIAVFVLVLSTLTACGNKAGKSSQLATVSNVQEVIEQQMKLDEAAKTEAESSIANTAESVTKSTTEKITESTTEEIIEETAAKEADGRFDVDLTALSSTLVYSEVYNMMVRPMDYVGKTVKMNGQFTLLQSMDENGEPVPGAIYYACLIADATACCSQGLEFVLEGDYVYPDDYPELGTDITVGGTFETYDEDGYTYCHLVAAAFEE